MLYNMYACETIMKETITNLRDKSLKYSRP